MLEKQRQQVILDILAEKGFASVTYLSDQLNASEATIRRDLIKLGELNKIEKIRGGAQALKDVESGKTPQSLQASNFLIDREIRPATKRAIAQKAVSICDDGEAIIVNGGSSTYMMSEFLVQRNLSILTNSFYLAQDLVSNGSNQVTLPGGEIYRRQGIVLSAFENDTIQHYHGTKMFMGTPGIGEFGVMESDPLLIRAEQKLLKQADQLVILADSSKLGKRSNLIFTGLDTVDVIITDSGADPKLLALFAKHNIEIHLVDQID
ncbi:DeoR/GlpR family DNA-binding transcription regulator [Halioxenophilus sp. WMMB6]|uniref:DeoR/GlpR family DNA-binding transcription regulator n=1 Tax=Halioxenophilus sp. WMMB6 TaxID=3073815 RepID=UPI00295E9458|nr:DeoR/GlpR family DNA-binding transcription regulator [Halioxenophilus sp. WMMB6]